MSADLASVPSESDQREWTVGSRADGSGDAVDIRIEIDGYEVTIGLYEVYANTCPASRLCISAQSRPGCWRPRTASTAAGSETARSRCPRPEVVGGGPRARSPRRDRHVWRGWRLHSCGYKYCPSVPTTPIAKMTKMPMVVCRILRMLHRYFSSFVLGLMPCPPIPSGIRPFCQYSRRHARSLSFRLPSCGFHHLIHTCLSHPRRLGATGRQPRGDGDDQQNPADRGKQEDERGALRLVTQSG
jgi:hypothetical protein